ncbi:helix-turn-helix transcriptional regulator [Oscillibacter sp.]
MGGFAENLKVLRSQKGWRQEDLANALGISKQVYLLGASDYEDHN